MSPRPPQRQYVTGTLVARSGFARQLGQILWPLVNQLSYLPGKLRRRTRPERYTQLLADLEQLVAAGVETVAAQRAALEARQNTTPVKPTVAVRYGEPRPWEIRLSHPMARDLCRLWHDLVKLDEEWALYAWNTEVERQITPEFLLHSEVANYEKWQQEQLDWVQQLSKDIRAHLKQLRQAGRPQPAASTPPPQNEENHVEETSHPVVVTHLPGRGPLGLRPGPQ